MWKTVNWYGLFKKELTLGREVFEIIKVHAVDAFEHYKQFLNRSFKCFIRNENSKLEDKYNEVVKHFNLV